MDFEELLGVIFVLYLLGSMVAGFFRRGRPRQSTDEKAPGRPGLPEVLDTDELERRLRELATGRREARPEPEPERQPVEQEPRPQRPIAPPTVAPTPPAPVRAPAALPVRRDEFGWDELSDAALQDADKQRRKRAQTAGQSLPPVIEGFVRRGDAWQAAFVMKEVLGPPRALSPHRGRPRF